jgi:hypothetical protein
LGSKHRDFDDVVDRLADKRVENKVQRLKNQKLLIQEQSSSIKNKIPPDIITKPASI